MSVLSRTAGGHTPCYSADCGVGGGAGGGGGGGELFVACSNEKARGPCYRGGPHFRMMLDGLGAVSQARH